MSKEAMKLALDKVQEFKSRWCKVPPFADRVNKATREAITLAQVPIFELEHVLQKALAEQPTQQEPLFKPLIDLHPGLAEELKAINAPAQRKPLDAGEISRLWKQNTSEDGPHHNPYDDDGLGFARAIEAAHGIKEQP